MKPMLTAAIMVFVGSVTSLPIMAADCPLSSLAPNGNLAPYPAQCRTPNCLISFQGYQWWTSYFVYPGSLFYGSNNQQSPKNATVDAEGLHLFISDQNTGGGTKPSAGEVVAMFKSDGVTPAEMGYGDYLVTVKVKSASSWDKLDPNVSFGAFTYERFNNGGTGTANNPNRELDLAEISHWGYAGALLPPSPPANPPVSCVTPKWNPLLDNRLCTGNSQFTLQIWDSLQQNLHRYSINGNVDTVTLVMSWYGANKPVTFKQYDGSYDLASLPSTPNNQWTTSGNPNDPTDGQNPYVPATNCERFHLNLWMGNYPDAVNNFNPPPASLPQEVVVTNFEFSPKQ